MVDPDMVKVVGGLNADDIAAVADYFSRLPTSTDAAQRLTGATMTGLTTAEAARRLELDGPNELAGSGPRSIGLIVREVLIEPMFILLLSAAGLYVVLGDIREALILSASVIIIIAITVLQERRTEHALARLKDLSSPRALVIREGVEQRIAGRDVVAEDVIVLGEGDRVPADAELIESTQLAIDESLLTGESLPIDKTTGASAEQSNVYSGTLVVGGFAKARVFATGSRTQLGAIGAALQSISRETSGLTLQVRTAVRWVATAAIILCVLVAVVYASTRGNWLTGTLAGITLAMGVLPEEFPVVLTVFLAMGAWRISKHGVLTRRMPAVEILGSTSVLAVDKTGTLTENKMSVAMLDDLEAVVDLRRSSSELPASTHADMLLVAFAASEREPFDAMEKAIHARALALLATRTAVYRERTLAREYDITPALLAVTHVWQADASTYEVAVKGAPETVMSMCHLSAAAQSLIQERVAQYGRQGLRVLAVASGRHSGQEMPASPREFSLQFLGLLCLADPLRKDVPAALRECSGAGIRVIMITGDHPGTALAIATQAGFDISAGVLTGQQLDAMDDAELAQRVCAVNVYARTTPQHKLRLVQALKARGDVVAMTGDGVNDAPALKAANVGVAMGGRGTDVAREAASIVLLNDDFASLVTAVRLGRRIYENLKHAVSFIVSVHIPIAGLGFIPVLLGWPLMFYPVHVLFLEFVIDPACSFVFEADGAKADLMKTPPRSPRSKLFSGDLLWRSLVSGVAALLFCVVLYFAALQSMPENQARALTFFGLVVMNLQLILFSRVTTDFLVHSLRERNRVLWWIIGVTLLATFLALEVPAIADVFRFEVPPASALAATLCAAIVVMFGLDWMLRGGTRTEPARRSIT